MKGFDREDFMKFLDSNDPTGEINKKSLKRNSNTAHVMVTLEKLGWRFEEYMEDGEPERLEDCRSMIYSMALEELNNRKKSLEGYVSSENLSQQRIRNFDGLLRNVICKLTYYLVDFHPKSEYYRHSRNEAVSNLQERLEEENDKDNFYGSGDV